MEAFARTPFYASAKVDLGGMLVYVLYVPRTTGASRQPHDLTFWERGPEPAGCAIARSCGGGWSMAEQVAAAGIRRPGERAGGRRAINQGRLFLALSGIGSLSVVMGRMVPWLFCSWP